MTKEYPFESPREDRLYNVFPDELENDPNVFFHGTADSNRDSIMREGFRNSGELASVSYATKSNLTLNYACGLEDGTQDGCVLAVRFDPIPDKGVVHEVSILHVYLPELQPEVIGYIVVPKEFKFI